MHHREGSRAVMRIAVLAATGTTGRLLVQQALDRGHTVLALARDPARIVTTASPHLTAVAADVTDRDSVVRALTDVDVVVSGLGVAKPGSTDPGPATVLLERVHLVLSVLLTGVVDLPVGRLSRGACRSGYCWGWLSGCVSGPILAVVRRP